MSLTRREFLAESLSWTAGLSLGAQFLPAVCRGETGTAANPLPVAAVVTEYRETSHADVILGKILEGYDQQGGPGPALKLVSLYTDQVPKEDLSRELSRKHGFRIVPTVAEALTLGTGKLAVAGVILIGEHGDYPETPDTHQQMYPRRRFFDETADVFEKLGKVVPVFNDKHLAYAWADARHMYDRARQMQIPFFAGSSLPVAWRNPSFQLPRDCRLTEAVAVGYGPLERYGFHTLEVLQCLAERRHGGETGVVAVQAVQGDRIWEAERAGLWSRALLNAALDKLPPESRKPGRIEELFTDEAAMFLIDYHDGLRATAVLANGVANQFAFAGQVTGTSAPLATSILTQEHKPFGHFGYLVQAIERLIQTKKAPYPVERTLLTTGVLDAAMHSLADGQKRRKTPELAVQYTAVDWPFPEGFPPGFHEQ
jgi:hypothetical protein